MAYFHIICSMAELARVKGELEIEKYAGQQAQKGDPDLDITKEMREVNESLEDAMNVRLATVAMMLPNAYICLLWCWPRCSCKLLSLVRRHWR